MEIKIIESIRHLWENRRSARIAKQKSDIRELAAQRRRIMTKDQVEEYSNRIISQLETLKVFIDAQSVMLYYPIHNEVDVRPILDKYADTKLLLLPVAHRTTIEIRPYTGKACLHKGKFGIPEPKEGHFNGKPDLIIVPGVAFDTRMNRLGRGRGYYDRFLKKFKKTPSIGLAYDKQVVSYIPTTWFDKKMTKIITQTKIYE